MSNILGNSSKIPCKNRLLMRIFMVSKHRIMFIDSITFSTNPLKAWKKASVMAVKHLKYNIPTTERNAKELQNWAKRINNH